MDTDDSTLMRDRVRPDLARLKTGTQKSSILSMHEAMGAEELSPAFPASRPEMPGADDKGHDSADGSDPLPSPADEYRAHGRATKLETGIAFILRDTPFEGFGYFDLRRVRLLPAAKPGEGPVLVLRFVEAEVTEVVIEGRNLLGLADYLRQHRIPWIREIPKGRLVDDPNAVVVTRITFREAMLRDGAS